MSFEIKNKIVGAAIEDDDLIILKTDSKGIIEPIRLDIEQLRDALAKAINVEPETYYLGLWVRKEDGSISEPDDSTYERVKVYNRFIGNEFTFTSSENVWIPVKVVLYNKDGGILDMGEPAYVKSMNAGDSVTFHSYSFLRSR